MGLLDDAIREHLELKRQHGADPQEVAQQEREALGAPQRGEFAQPQGAAEAAEPDGAPPLPPSDPAEAPGAEATSEALPPEGAAVEEDPPPPPAGYEEDPWLDEDADEVPAADALEPSQPPPEGEDVLEETPEFLQETPEHDRLWFEQKPPRDFDWDK